MCLGMPSASVMCGGSPTFASETGEVNFLFPPCVENVQIAFSNIYSGTEQSYHTGKECVGFEFV